MRHQSDQPTDGPHAYESPVRLVITYDGTTTAAELVQEVESGPFHVKQWHVLGQGRARRRPGDRRCAQTGIHLAKIRAVEMYLRTLKQELWMNRPELMGDMLTKADIKDFKRDISEHRARASAQADEMVAGLFGALPLTVENLIAVAENPEESG